MSGTTLNIAVLTLLFIASTRAQNAHKVIYINYKPINWVDPSVTTNAIVDMGYNVINLAFWLYDEGPVDFAGVWSSAPASQRQAAINYAHARGAKIMISCGGATESPFERDPVNYGTRVGQYAANNMLDGIDFDLENFERGLVAPLKNSQQTLDWIVAANNAARSAFVAIRGTQPIISHAPQAPYFGRVGDSSSWAGALGGYTAVEKNTKVDFYNVQFYNQGPTCYTSYEGLFVRSASGCTVFPGTSISEINQWGVPMNKIILGKPLRTDDAGNGHVTSSTLSNMIRNARNNGINWNAGVMFWMFHGNDQSSAANMIQSLSSALGTGTSSTGSTSSSGTSTSTGPITSGTSTSTSGNVSPPTSGTSSGTPSGTGSSESCITGTSRCNSTPESSGGSYQCCAPGTSCFNNGSSGICCGPSTAGCIYGTTIKRSTCCDTRYTVCDATNGCVNK